MRVQFILLQFPLAYISRKLDLWACNSLHDESVTGKLYIQYRWVLPKYEGI
jgi:hypothetical protein